MVDRLGPDAHHNNDLLDLSNDGSSNHDPSSHNPPERHDDIPCDVRSQPASFEPLARSPRPLARRRRSSGALRGQLAPATIRFTANWRQLELRTCLRFPGVECDVRHHHADFPNQLWQPSTQRGRTSEIMVTDNPAAPTWSYDGYRGHDPYHA